MLPVDAEAQGEAETKGSSSAKGGKEVRFLVFLAMLKRRKAGPHGFLSRSSLRRAGPQSSLVYEIINPSTTDDSF